TLQHSFEVDDEPEVVAVVEDLSERVSSSATILLVEEDGAYRQSLSNGLRQRDYDVIEASDAKDAVRLAFAHHGPIHLLLANIKVPGLPRTTLAEALS